MESTSLANVDDADLDLDDYCLDFGGYDLDPEDYTLHLEDDLDLDDYLKWRNENTHVGLESCTDQALRIWVPETTSFNDKPLRARLRPRKSQGPVFRFLDLPPELRDCVYEAVFNPFYGLDSICNWAYADIDIAVYIEDDYQPTLRKLLSYPILQMSRIIRHEALHVMFTRTTWRVRSLREVHKFLNLIYSCSTSLHSMWIQDDFFPGIWDSSFVTTVIKMLNSLPCLQNLYVDLRPEECGSLLKESHDTLDFTGCSNAAQLADLRGVAKLELSFAVDFKHHTRWSWHEREKEWRVEMRRRSPNRLKRMDEKLRMLRDYFQKTIHLPQPES